MTITGLRALLPTTTVPPCIVRVNQSVILPIWGEYGGSTGVVLQYLSLGEEVVVWARRGKTSKKCASFASEFVVACQSRGNQFDLENFHPTGNSNLTQEYPRDVNSYLPNFSLFSPPTRQGFFHHSIAVNVTVDHAIQTWARISSGDWMGPETEELGIQWIVVSSVTRIITLVQASFLLSTVGCECLVSERHDLI